MSEQKKSSTHLNVKGANRRAFLQSSVAASASVAGTLLLQGNLAPKRDTDRDRPQSPVVTVRLRKA